MANNITLPIIALLCTLFLVGSFFFGRQAVSEETEIEVSIGYRNRLVLSEQGVFSTREGVRKSPASSGLEEAGELRILEIILFRKAGGCEGGCAQ
mgnify:CR=1 FL=1